MTVPDGTSKQMARKAFTPVSIWQSQPRQLLLLQILHLAMARPVMWKKQICKKATVKAAFDEYTKNQMFRVAGDGDTDATKYPYLIWTLPK